MGGRGWWGGGGHTTGPGGLETPRHCTHRLTSRAQKHGQNGQSRQNGGKRVKRTKNGGRKREEKRGQMGKCSIVSREKY